MPLSNERLTDIANKLFWDEQVDRVALAAWLAGKRMSQILYLFAKILPLIGVK